MKKITALCFVAVLVGLLAFYGRDALDLYRLMSFMDTTTQARPPHRRPWPG